MGEIILSSGEQEELSAYTANRFEGCSETAVQDTEYLKPWKGIVQYAEENGAAAALNELVCHKRPVGFRAPEELSISIDDSFAGKLPVIRVGNAEDFEELVVNIAHKGVRPDNIEKTGASFIHGKTTRFMILSYKPYSNVPAADLGLDDDEWIKRSMELRFCHECTHFFTRQTYGIANNILHDELMADFTGVYEAFGFYKAEWFLRFMGIKGSEGGRMIYYTMELSDNVRRALEELIREAAEGLERWSRSDDFAGLTTGERIKRMCFAGISGMREME